jgi:hypothetical protein
VHILPDGEPTSVVIELVRDAARDLSAYMRQGPNYRSAGLAALTDLSAAIRLLTEIRSRLAVEIGPDGINHVLGNEPSAEPSGDAVVDLLRELMRERYGIGASDGR